MDRSTLKGKEKEMVSEHIAIIPLFPLVHPISIPYISTGQYQYLPYFPYIPPSSDPPLHVAFLAPPMTVVKTLWFERGRSNANAMIVFAMSSFHRWRIRFLFHSKIFLFMIELTDWNLSTAVGWDRHGWWINGSPFHQGSIHSFVSVTVLMK